MCGSMHTCVCVYGQEGIISLLLLRVGWRWLKFVYGWCDCKGDGFKMSGEGRVVGFWSACGIDGISRKWLVAINKG